MSEKERRPIVLRPGAGRSYQMGGISAVFKADGVETARQYSISEWWLEPDTEGPGAHSHPEDDAFYVLEGTMSFLVDDEWVDAVKGSFVLVPAGRRSQPVCTRRLRTEHGHDRGVVRQESSRSGRRLTIPSWRRRAAAAGA